MSWIPDFKSLGDIIDPLSSWVSYLQTSQWSREVKWPSHFIQVLELVLGVEPEPRLRTDPLPSHPLKGVKRWERKGGAHLRGGMYSPTLSAGFLACGLPAHHWPGLGGHPHQRVALAYPHRLHSWHHPHLGLQGAEAHGGPSWSPLQVAQGAFCSTDTFLTSTSFLYLSICVPSSACAERAFWWGWCGRPVVQNLFGGEQVGWNGWGEDAVGGLCPDYKGPWSPGALKMWKELCPGKLGWGCMETGQRSRQKGSQSSQQRYEEDLNYWPWGWAAWCCWGRCFSEEDPTSLAWVWGVRGRRGAGRDCQGPASAVACSVCWVWWSGDSTSVGWGPRQSGLIPPCPRWWQPWLWSPVRMLHPGEIPRFLRRAGVTEQWRGTGDLRLGWPDVPF